MTDLDQNFWDQRYHSGETGWDVGQVSKPLKGYFDQLVDDSLKILIPGAGNAHEAEYLHNNGFKNVYVVDISPKACDNFTKRVPSFPKDHVICNNFFNLTGAFDLIIEQTFFCALDPSLRKSYAKKCSDLLNKGGKLVGVMFDFPLTEDGPPFGGCIEEYNNYFLPSFSIEIMEKSKNSIESRESRELFVKMIKK